MKITVIGAGSWGTALANVLSDNNHEVLLYTYNEDEVHDINVNHRCEKLDNAPINETIKATSNINEAAEFADYILLAVPTKVMRLVLGQLNQVLKSKKVFINAAKGIEPTSFKRVSEIVEEEIDEKYFGQFTVITGPSHAEEVIKKMVTTVVVAGTDENACIEVQELFNNDKYFRVYRSNDLIGCELGGAIKNVIALASGIIYGLGFGDNTRAALITRGIVEIKRLSVALGAKEETLSGLAGIGDLIVTATSMHSRNFQAGYKIGVGNDLDEAIDSLTMVVEGARTCEATYFLSKKLVITTPIIDATYNIIFKKQNPHDAISRLLSREMTQE